MLRVEVRFKPSVVCSVVGVGWIATCAPWYSVMLVTGRQAEQVSSIQVDKEEMTRQGPSNTGYSTLPTKSFSVFKYT